MSAMIRLTSVLILLFALALTGCRPGGGPTPAGPETPAANQPSALQSEIEQAGMRVIDLVVDADLTAAVAAYHQYRVKLGGMDDLALIHAAFGETLLGGLIATEPPEGHLTKILAILGKSDRPVQLEWVRGMLADESRAPLALSALREWYGTEVDDVCREALASEETQLVTIAATYLVEDGYTGAEEQARTLIAEDDWKRSVSGYRILRITHPGEAEELLVERLRTSEDTLSIRLCQLAREWEIPLPLSIIERLTERINPDVRTEAALTLLNCEGPEYNELMVKLIETGKLDVSLAAAEILYNRGDPRGEQALRKFVTEEIGAGRFRAAAPLYASGDKSVVDGLKPFIGDIRQSVRLAVAWNLRLFGEPLIEFFDELLFDSDEQVRMTAIDSLGEIGGEDAATMLGDLSEVDNAQMRYGALKNLGSINAPNALTQALRFVSDEDPAVRRSAARALGEIGDKAAAQTLSELMRDEDSTVGVEATRSLGRLGDPDLGKYLLPLIDDSKLGSHALDQLIRLGRMEALEPLLVKIASKPGPDELLSAAEGIFTLCAAQRDQTG